MASLALWTPIGFSPSSPYPIPFHKSNYLDLEQIFVKSLPGFSDLGVPTSHFFYPCNGVVFHPTWTKMPDIRKTRYITIDVIKVTSLSIVDLLPSFPNILCSALSTGNTIYHIWWFACYGLLDGENLSCGSYGNRFAKCSLATCVTSFVLALVESFLHFLFDNLVLMH